MPGSDICHIPVGRARVYDYGMRGGRVARHGAVRFRWGRVAVVLVLGVVNLGVLGTDVFLVTQRNVTRPVTLGAALRRFRAQQGTDRAADPVAASALPATSTTNATTTTAASARHVSAVRAASGPAVSAAAPFGVPLEGVYAYRTTGGEQVNILDSSHSYPSTTYATVRRGTGCQWVIENDVIQEHTDRRQLCSASGQFLEIAQSREVTFFGKTDGGNYTCAPQLDMISAGEAPGSAHDSVCSDGNGMGARLHAVDLGSESVTVSGTLVTVVHVVIDGTLTGRAVGTSHDDLLLLAATGMTVSWTRSVDTVADAAFGAKAHYTEHASFFLLSLLPQR